MCNVQTERVQLHVQVHWRLYAHLQPGRIATAATVVQSGIRRVTLPVLLGAFGNRR